MVLFSPSSGHIAPLTPEIAAFGKRKSRFHALRQSDFRAVVQVGIDIRRSGKTAVPQPFLNVL